MKTSVLQENLKEGLAMIKPFVNNKAEPPVLRNVKLVAEDNWLIISAVNLSDNAQATVKIGAKTTQQGETTLPFLRFYELVMSLPEDKVEMMSVNDITALVCQNRKVKINGIPSDTFPVTRSFDAKISISGEIFRRMVARVYPTAGEGEERPVFAATHWILEPDGVIIAETLDGHRGTKTFGNYITGPNQTERITFMIDAVILKNAINKLRDEDMVSLYIDKDNISVQLPYMTVNARLINGTFPDINTWIPRSTATTIKINRMDMLKAIQSIGVFSKENGNYMRLETEKDIVKFSSRSPELGNIEIPIETECEAGIIYGLNSKYMQEAAQVMYTDEVTMHFVDGLGKSPVLITPLDQTDLTVLLLPMAVR